MFFRTFCAILAVITAASCLKLSAIAADTDSDNTPDAPIITTVPVREYESRFNLPGNMRGVMLTQRQAANSVAELSDWGMNTAIITPDSYNTDLNQTDQPDQLAEVITAAQDVGLNVFLVFDVNAVVFADGGDMSSALNALITEVHKFTLRYRPDGIILDNYYNVRGEESFERYMTYGAGIGYENHLFDTVREFIIAAADTVRLTDNTIPVGLMLRDVWRNQNDTAPSGSKTNADFEAFGDGFADTLGLITDNAVDFAVVHTPDALTESAVKVPFEEITNYWGRICKNAGLPMYVLHYNQRIGEQSAGWLGEDQLLRQILSARGTPAYGGSVFNSVGALRENRLNSTDTLRAFYSAQINEETLFENLELNSPRRRNYTTSDAFAIFQGTHDDNFPVYINDEQITLNEAGNFYLESALEVGMNRFTLRHKGQTVNYTIERKIITLHSLDAAITNGRKLDVEGGTAVTIGAIAYKGASVTATIGGQKISLTEQKVPLDDSGLNVSYARFSGTYHAPAGIVGSAQNLGTINVTAAYAGFANTIIGAALNVIALPDIPAPPPTQVTWYDRDSAGSGEVVGRINAVRTSSESVQYVRVLANDTHTFAANTSGVTRDPNYSPLPTGAKDYLRSRVGDYVTTVNGKRLHKDDVTVENGNGMGDNALVVLAGGTASGSAFLRIAIDHRSTFNMRLGGVEYSTAWGGEFNVNRFDATHLFIDFDNVTSVTQLPSFEHNMVFSGGRWETVTTSDITKFRLILELRQKGAYAGHLARYDESGQLMLTFPVKANSLSGMNIVIDPGHGVTASGFDPGAVGHIRESDANIAVARQLRDKLRARGANAVVLPTHESGIEARKRPETARNNHNVDLFISLHCNSAAGNGAAKGQEAWYFTPYSQPLAAAVSASLAGYFRDNVYADKTARNRGAKQSTFLVTIPQDFPSILVEMGFVTNMDDAMALANPAHQAGAATAIADGVQAYLR